MLLKLSDLLIHDINDPFRKEIPVETRIEELTALSDMLLDEENIHFIKQQRKFYKLKLNELIEKQIGFKKERTREHSYFADKDYDQNRIKINVMEIILTKLHSKKNYLKYIKSKISKDEFDFWHDNKEYNLKILKNILLDIYQEIYDHAIGQKTRRNNDPRDFNKAYAIFLEKMIQRLIYSKFPIEVVSSYMEKRDKVIKLTHKSKKKH